MYIQYTCYEDNTEIVNKKRAGLLVACIGIFICCIFMCTTFYLSKTSYYDYKLWDVYTVTAADFTVEYTIPKAVWKRFISLPESQFGSTKAVAFENYLKSEFEKIVSA